ncbi:MAG: rod shape-determining protein RodA [Chloroflexota bacterium]|nr:rod shape-determining protein RodA [Chloroflexota bacterium]
MTWRDFDYVLLLLTLLLMGLGVVMISSATQGSLALQGLARRQAIYAAAGLLLMMALGALDYRALSHLRGLIYGLVIFMLLLLFVVGHIHDARRWIDLGAFTFQPSELSKVLIILVLASYLAHWEGSLHKLRYILLSLIYVIPPIILIYLQPDLGTALVVGVIWLAMVFVSGMRVLHLLLMGLMGIGAVPFIWWKLEGYMRARLLLFLKPGFDPAKRYNMDQALISIGSGGWLGKGLTGGSQSQLHFLRIRHTDFIFSVIGEELGFVGTILVIILLVLLILRLLRIAERARDTFGRLIALGTATMIAFQSLVNIGMNVGLLPVVGIPLPFISYGGSSLLSILIAEGLAQSVALRHRKIDFELQVPTAQLAPHEHEKGATLSSVDSVTKS